MSPSPPLATEKVIMRIMAVLLRRRPIFPVELVLVRAPGEDNRTSPADFMIPECKCEVRRHNPITHSEWMVIVTSTASVALANFASAVTQAVSGWLRSKNGRHYRYRRGNEEWEAPSKDELLELIRSAGDEIRIRIIPSDTDR